MEIYDEEGFGCGCENGTDNGRTVQRAVRGIRSSAGREKRPPSSVGSGKTGNSNRKYQKTGNGGCVIPQVGDENCAAASQGGRGFSRDSAKIEPSEKERLIREKAREFLGFIKSIDSPRFYSVGNCFICGRKRSKVGNVLIHEKNVLGKIVNVCSVCVAGRIVISIKNRLDVDDDLVCAKWLANNLIKGKP